MAHHHKTTRPTVGVAISGGSSRAIAALAVLEVLKERNIPIDYMVGCSSGAIVAAAFIGNTLKEFKEWMQNTSLQEMYKYWTINPAFRGGIYNIDSVEVLLKKFLNGATFENARPKIGFVAADIKTGELITLSMGDVIMAIKASIAVPGLFEPVVWGNKLLVDGGLVSIVPTLPVKQLGADVVIGIDVSGWRFIYELQMPMWRRWRVFTKVVGWEFMRRQQAYLTQKFLNLISYAPANETDKVKVPSVFSILSQALDVSMKVADQWKESDLDCDVMIKPKVRQYHKTEMDNLREIYLEGRKAAEESIPAILQAMENFQKNESEAAQAKESRAS